VLGCTLLKPLTIALAILAIDNYRTVLSALRHTHTRDTNTYKVRKAEEVMPKDSLSIQENVSQVGKHTNLR